jgi:hypothetical protein
VWKPQSLRIALFKSDALTLEAFSGASNVFRRRIYPRNAAGLAHIQDCACDRTVPEPTSSTD